MQGKITVDGIALPPNSPVAFHPDASKGNTMQVTPNGVTAADGAYTLSTEGRLGAPPGFYKVTISYMGPPQTQINAKYNDAAKSDLAVEVVDNPEPGRYDLKAAR